MPILHDVAQRSEAWDLLRLGTVTASCFHMIVTPGGKSSAQWETYADHLLAERYLKRQVDTYTSPQMERSAALEDEAVAWYEWSKDIETKPIGFISSVGYTEENPGGHRWYRYGASPDRLVGDNGLLEIKVHAPPGQMNLLRTGKIAQKYKPQLQGQLFVSNREWVDVVGYNPELPRISVREERDEKFIAKLEEEILHFADEIDRVYRMICAANGTSAPKAELREMLNRSLEAS
jgi:hypothetical protein